MLLDVVAVVDLKSCWNLSQMIGKREWRHQHVERQLHIVFEVIGGLLLLVQMPL